MLKFSISFFSIVSVAASSVKAGKQFLLFDKTLPLKKDAVQTKSHLYVEADELNKITPKDWRIPVNYADGKVHASY